MIQGINHLTLAVKDIDRSLAFYTDVLGLQGHVVWENGAYLSAGSLWLCLSVDDVDSKIDYTHFAFTVSEEEFDGFTQALLRHGVRQWKQNSSEGDSLYFLDPDGHKLEVHTGNLLSRLESLKSTPYANQEWL